MAIRAFFCVELEEGLKTQLDQITQRLRRLPVRASWVKAENLHITLKFLGDVDEALIPKLEEAAREALRRSPLDGAVRWTLDRLGAFPSADRPRVVWVGSSHEPRELAELAAHLEEVLEPLGFAPEGRGFVAHITLGRVKERAPSAHVAELARVLQRHPEFHYEARVEGVTLMKSDLTPQGAIYTPVFRLPFGASSSESEEEERRCPTSTGITQGRHG